MLSSALDNICLYMTTTEYLSVRETARTLGLSEATVYRRVWDGSLPVVRLTDHGAIRIPRAALLPPGARILAERGVPADAGQSTSPQHGGRTEER
jgi:excisionase family DNA binding protein